MIDPNKVYVLDYDSLYRLPESQQILYIFDIIRAMGFGIDGSGVIKYNLQSIVREAKTETIDAEFTARWADEEEKK